MVAGATQSCGLQEGGHSSLMPREVERQTPFGPGCTPASSHEDNSEKERSASWERNEMACTWNAAIRYVTMTRTRQTLLNTQATNVL